MQKAYIALGSNLGDRAYHLRRAIEEIERSAHFSLQAISPTFETVPIAALGDLFLNMVIVVSTSLHAETALVELLKIEKKLGRTRDYLAAPRTIDLDLLICEDEVVNTSTCQVPHPRMTTRGFVLSPLVYLAPDLIVPGQQKKILALWREWATNDGAGVQFYHKNDAPSSHCLIKNFEVDHFFQTTGDCADQERRGK